MNCLELNNQLLPPLHSIEAINFGNVLQTLSTHSGDIQLMLPRFNVPVITTSKPTADNGHTVTINCNHYSFVLARDAINVFSSLLCTVGQYTGTMLMYAKDYYIHITGVPFDRAPYSIYVYVTPFAMTKKEMCYAKQERYIPHGY